MSDEQRQEVVDAMIAMKDQFADFEDLIAEIVENANTPTAEDFLPL